MDPHRAQISKEFIDQAEGRGIFVDPVSVGTCGKSRTGGRYRCMMGNQTIEDLDIDEADFQQLWMS